MVTKKSEDLRINRNLNIKVKNPITLNPQIVEIGISLYAVPRETRKEEEYITSIRHITSKCNKALHRYAYKNKALFTNKIITDFSFTSANLKKGYNKYVTMSMMVRQIKDYNIDKLRNEIKKTIKGCSFEITSALQEEGFSCYKTKHI